MFRLKSVFLTTLIFIPLFAMTQVTPQKERPLAIERGKFFEKEGRKMLWGGEGDEGHFDITGYLLKDEQFHYGIGRERFPALLQPQFYSVAEADVHFEHEDRFILLHMEGETRAYSVKDLTRHEVVNDVINGRPVMAVYCILADLGAVYDRSIGGLDFTFALSGYTYFDPEVWDGMDGFVMWDRETESLWWPLIGKAVSGKMQGTAMRVLEDQYWKQTTWDDVKTNYPAAAVMKSGLDFERPTSWRKYEEIDLKEPGSGETIAPRWGENDRLGRTKKN